MKFTLFLISEQLIQVYSLIDYTFITEYGFSNLDLTPKALSFPNSSNMYVIFENSNKMIIVDRQFQEISNFEFDLPDKPISFDSKADNIFIACADNMVYQFKTNSKTITNSFRSLGKPELVKADPFKDEIILVSNGDDENSNNSSVIYFLSINDLSSITETELIERFDDHNEMVANNISFTDNDVEFAYITTNEGLIRVDTRNKGVFIFSNYSNSDLVYYNFTFQEIYTYSKESNILNIYNALNSNLETTVNLPAATSFIIPNN